MKNFLKYYPTTIYLTLLQLFIFIVIHLDTTQEKNIVYYGAAYHEWILDGEVWRLITAIFLHTDFTHLFYNVFIFMLIATFLECYRTSLFVFTIFLSSGILANLILLFCHHSTMLHYGSSCAIAGLLGSLICLICFKKIPLPFYTVPLLFVVSFFHIIVAIFSLQTNAYGHFLGLVAGIIFTFLYKWQ